MKEINRNKRLETLNNNTLQRVFLFLFLAIGYTLTITAQNQSIVPELEKALNSGKASDISKYFAENVNIAIPGTDGVFTNEQAGVILKEFFRQNKPTQFKLTHKGKSGEGASYLVGNLSCGSKKFTIYILMRDSTTKPVIKQFQAEAD